MHRLGDVVDVRLVEAAPIAGALRFELLSEGRVAPRRRREAVRQASGTEARARPGRSSRNNDRKRAKGKRGKSNKGRP
jgi:ribonuclease R